MNATYPESAVMTTTNTKTSSKSRIRFPDIPERTPDDMTSAKAIHLNGKSHYLGLYFAERPNTVVDAEHYISRIPTRDMTGVVYPDLLVSFDADPQALDESNAYVISEQGKPPDFILEIASRRTRTHDRTTKRDIYASLEVPEYWRFDQNPTRSNPPLAGERLVNGRYEPIPVQELGDGILQGHSTALGLLIRWDHGNLEWWDPKTEAPIPTLETEREARLEAEQGRQEERVGRIEAEQSHQREREARLEAEAKTRELQAQLARRDREG